jgi:hypothetical protein
MSKKSKIAKAKKTSIGAALEAGVTLTAKAPVVDNSSQEAMAGPVAPSPNNAAVADMTKGTRKFLAGKKVVKVESQQSVIYDELVRRATDGAISAGEIPAILAAVKAKFPKGTATAGYVGFVAAHKCTPAIAILRTAKVAIATKKAKPAKAAKVVVRAKANGVVAPAVSGAVVEMTAH